MMKIVDVLSLLLIFTSASVCMPAQAWDGAVAGKVSAYEIVALENGGTNYDFRVQVDGVTVMCTGGAGGWG